VGIPERDREDASWVDQLDDTQYGMPTIGLPMCRQFAYAMKGDVGLRDVGPWTQFWLTVPDVGFGGEPEHKLSDVVVLHADSEPSDNNSDDSRITIDSIHSPRFRKDADAVWSKIHKQYVMVVDDVSGIRRITRNHINHILPSMDVVELVDGCDIEPYIRCNGWPVLIFLDNVMATMSGEDAIVYIRNQTTLVPVVALTASVEPRALRRYARIGFTAVVAKPTTHDNIRKALDYLNTPVEEWSFQVYMD
jgi:CheY-like chemotaxis protein